MKKRYIVNYGVKGVVKLFLFEVVCKCYNVRHSFFCDASIDVVIASIYGNRVEINLESESLTIYGGGIEEKYKYLLESGFFNYLSTPVIEYGDNRIVEKFIVNKNVSLRVVFLMLIRRYSKYLNSKNIERNESFGSLVHDNCRRVGGHSEYKDLVIPLFKLHGDLHYENIFYDDSALYVIDYEHSGEYPFFYDLFVFATMRLISNNDLSLLHDVFDTSGIVYLELRQIFENMGLTLNTSLVAFCVLFTFDYYIEVNCFDKSDLVVWERKYVMLEKCINDLQRKHD